MKKFVFETSDHIVMHGIGKNNPTIYRTEEGEAYIFLGDDIFYPLYMQGKHVNVNDEPDGGGYHYRNSADHLHLGPRERDIKVSTLTWREKQELIPVDERIARLDNKTSELQDNYLKLSSNHSSRIAKIGARLEKVENHLEQLEQSLEPEEDTGEDTKTESESETEE